MIRDITIGQYYPAQSPIHKLDPRVKLFATLIYIIALFSYKGIAGVLFIVAALAAVIKISKVPFKFMVKGLKSIIILRPNGNRMFTRFYVMKNKLILFFIQCSNHDDTTCASYYRNLAHDTHHHTKPAHGRS